EGVAPNGALITVDGKKTLLFSTILKALSLLPHRIVIITDKLHENSVRNEIHKVERSETYLDLIENQDIIFVVIAEPEGKGNALSSALSTYVLDHPNNNNVTVMMPSDQIVKKDKSFKQAIKSAYTIARKGYIVTLGIAPPYPTTCYGYIETENLKSKKWYTIKDYKETNDKGAAVKYFNDENFYYNSSILVFRTCDMIREIEKHIPQLALQMKKITNLKVSNPSFNKVVTNIYSDMKSLYLENNLLKKSKNSVLIPASFKWCDIQSCSDSKSLLAKGKKKKKKKKKKALCNSVRCFDAKNGLNSGKKKMLAHANSEELMVLDTNDALFVCEENSVEGVETLFHVISRGASEKDY
ncbi:sugar phosphate nucleotidyltransferase, partial [Thermodesulfobacteriota bacterium]